MKNVEVEVSGDKMVLTVDLSKDFGPSKSAKTIIIASSEGNASVPDREGIRFGFNVFRSKKEK